MSEELMPWHKTWLVDIDYDRVDLVKEGANSMAKIKLFKSKGDLTMNPELQALIAKMKPEHQAQLNLILKAKDDEIADAKKEAEDAKEELEKVKSQSTAPNAETPEEEILKTVKDPAVKALLETQIAKTKAAEAVAKSLKAAEEEKEAIAKAKEVPNLGAEETKLAEVYKKLKTVDENLCNDVFGIFKAASAMVAQGGVLEEIGKTAADAGTLATSEEEAWNKIEKAAEEIAKSNNLSKAASISKAISENPELYQAYLKAQTGE